MNSDGLATRACEIARQGTTERLRRQIIAGTVDAVVGAYRDGADRVAAERIRGCDELARAEIRHAERAVGDVAGDISSIGFAIRQSGRVDPNIREDVQDLIARIEGLVEAARDVIREPVPVALLAAE